MADYIITGICGHLGNTLARSLCRAGHRVTGLALPGENRSMLADLPVRLLTGDVRDPATLRPLFTGLNAPRVIHCAGIITVASGYSQLVEDVNLGGTANMLELAGEYGAESFVFSSTSDLLTPLPGVKTMELANFDEKIYNSQYAITKAVASNLTLNAAPGLQACVVQPTAIVGPGDYGTGPATKLILMYLSGKLPVGIAGGYDFVDVRDVANGIIAASERGRAGECYILSGHFLGLTEALNLLAEVSSGKPVRLTLPGWLARLAAPAAELVSRLQKSNPVFTPASVKVLLSCGHFSSLKAQTELGYSVRSIADTFRDTVAFLQSTGRVKSKA